MIQVRNGVFETNSSSTHSLCISKKKIVDKPLHMEFYLRYFGWEEDEYDPSDYIYTAIIAHDVYHEDDKWLPRLRSFLIENDVTWYFDNPEDMRDEWGYDFGIDHENEIFPAIDKLLDDHDMLARALFGKDSIVYTGNDNIDWDDDNPPMSDVGCEYSYVREDGDWVRKKVGNWNHLYYDPDNFDYIYKGN